MDATTRKSDDPVPHGSSSSGCDIRHLKRRITFLRNLTEASLSRAGVERAARVLDLGCGTGDASLLIAKLVGPSGLVVGVERSAEAIDVAQKRATVTGQCYWAMFVVADPDMFVATRSIDAFRGGCRGDQAQPRQAQDHGACHRRALAHDADDVERLKACDDGVGVRQMVVEHGDARAPIQHRPVGHRQGDVLVVIQDSYFDELLLGGHKEIALNAC
jgi:SAM-dependent methyltransferase